MRTWTLERGLVNDPLIKEVLPEERLAKVVQVLALHHNMNDMSVTDLAALLSPYMQLELEDKAHQERVLCLSDFYNLEERADPPDRLASGGSSVGRAGVRERLRESLGGGNKNEFHHKENPHHLAEARRELLARELGFPGLVSGDVSGSHAGRMVQSREVCVGHHWEQGGHGLGS